VDARIEPERLPGIAVYHVPLQIWPPTAVEDGARGGARVEGVHRRLEKGTTGFLAHCDGSGMDCRLVLMAVRPFIPNHPPLAMALAALAALLVISWLVRLLSAAGSLQKVFPRL